MKNIIKYIFLFHLLMFCAWAYPSTYTLRGLSVSDGLSSCPTDYPDCWSMPFIKTLWDLSG